MEKLIVFVIVVLLAIVRGLLQRRQVARDLEQRLAKARGGPKIRRLGERLSAIEKDNDTSDNPRPDQRDEVAH